MSCMLFPVFVCPGMIRSYSGINVLHSRDAIYPLSTATCQSTDVILCTTVQALHMKKVLDKLTTVAQVRYIDLIAVVTRLKALPDKIRIHSSYLINLRLSDILISASYYTILCTWLFCYS